MFNEMGLALQPYLFENKAPDCKKRKINADGLSRRAIDARQTSLSQEKGVGCEGLDG